MPKKDKLYTKLITASVREPLFNSILKITESTGIKKAALFRSLCEENIPQVSFDKQFWKDVKGDYFVKKEMSKEEVIEEICFSLGIEWAGGFDVIMDGETHKLNVSGANGIIGTVSIVESFYKLVYPNVY